MSWKEFENELMSFFGSSQIAFTKCVPLNAMSYLISEGPKSPADSGNFRGGGVGGGGVSDLPPEWNII